MAMGCQRAAIEPKDTGSARYHDDQLAGQGSKGFGTQALHVLHHIERSLLVDEVDEGLPRRGE
jgi:hypothetical protein